MNRALKVFIEYCGRWGYYPKYLSLESELLRLSKNQLNVEGMVGRAGSFEVTVFGDGKEILVHSKLASGAFPDMKALATKIVSGEF